MSKQNGNKGRRFDRAFKEEAVRLLQTSGRRQRQIAGDLGISVSALGRWVAELREEDLLSGPHEDAAKEITRLRRERDLARQAQWRTPSGVCGVRTCETISRHVRRYVFCYRHGPLAEVRLDAALDVKQLR